LHRRCSDFSRLFYSFLYYLLGQFNAEIAHAGLDPAPASACWLALKVRWVPGIRRNDDPGLIVLIPTLEHGNENLRLFACWRFSRSFVTVDFFAAQ